MVQTWLRDAVLAGLSILGLAFGLEHASEAEAIGRKLARQAETALTPAPPVPRLPQARVVTTPVARPVRSSVSTRRPPPAVVQFSESWRRNPVRVIPPVPTAPRRMISCYPSWREPSCGWQWIPVANCNRW